jgi:antitoxin (DNA-binding transcriptional repressor) of toxin-antitoxin stability system
MNIAIKDTTLDELVRHIEAGEHVMLTRNGKPFARIEPTVSDDGRPRLLGALKGKIWIADDFDELGPEWDEYTK